MVNPAVIKAAAALLSNEKTRKGAGWIIVAILSPVILLIALLCSLGSGASSHNNAVVNLCFNGGMLPPDMPPEYAAYIEEMRSSFAQLDGFISAINGMTEGETALTEQESRRFFSLCTSARTIPSPGFPKRSRTVLSPMSSAHAQLRWKTRRAWRWNRRKLIRWRPL